MASLSRVQNQVTILLNANTRDGSGNPVYSSAVGDKARHATEIETSCYNAAMAVGRAICEAGSSPFKEPFIEVVDLDHGEPVPTHYGDTSVPEIVPFSGATFTLRGIRSTPDRIDSYRRNRNNIYSPVAHNASDGGQASPIAGRYDIANGIFYFTGFSATMMVGSFERADVFAKIPDALELTIVKLALGYSAKEGDTSDGLFSSWAVQGQNDLDQLRAGGSQFQPIDMGMEARATI